MCLKKKSKLFSTVTFRLSLLFVLLFTLLLIGVLIPIDITLRSILVNRLDARISAHLGNFSYYGLLFERKTKEEALKIITDNLRWTASSVSEDQVLWLMLSETKGVIASSNTQSWKASIDAIIRAIPDLPHYGELSQPVQPETLNQKGLRFVEIEGVKQLAAFKTLSFTGKPGRYRTAFMKYHNGMIMIAVYGLNDINQQMTIYRQVLAIAFGVVLVVGGGLGFLITRKAMKGVLRITQTARSIGRGDLNQRVTLNRQGREIDDLAQAFNEMLGRIQGLIKELKEVTTNIAHDLRSPVTRIRGTAETVLQNYSDIDTYRDANGRIIAECDNLVSIINTMLEIAAMDAGTQELPKSSVDIDMVVRGACELFQPVAEDKGVLLHLNNHATAATVRGSKENLQRVVSNVLDNAIKFTPKGGRVDVETTSTESHISICIRDTGIGISKENQKRIFDRFFRVDTSRSTDGNGLGLSLAQSIVKAHGGDINVESQQGQGSRFTVILPRS